MLDTPNQMFRESFQNTVEMALCFEAVLRGCGYISIKRDSWVVTISLFDASKLEVLIESEKFYEYSRALEVMGNVPGAKGKFVYSEYSQTAIGSAEQMVKELRSIPLIYEVEYRDVRDVHQD